MLGWFKRRRRRLSQVEYTSEQQVVLSFIGRLTKDVDLDLVHVDTMGGAYPNPGTVDCYSAYVVGWYHRLPENRDAPRGYYILKLVGSVLHINEEPITFGERTLGYEAFEAVRLRHQRHTRDIAGAHPWQKPTGLQKLVENIQGPAHS